MGMIESIISWLSLCARCPTALPVGDRNVIGASYNANDPDTLLTKRQLDQRSPITFGGNVASFAGFSEPTTPTGSGFRPGLLRPKFFSSADRPSRNQALLLCSPSGGLGAVSLLARKRRPQVDWKRSSTRFCAAGHRNVPGFGAFGQPSSRTAMPVAGSVRLCPKAKASKLGRPEDAWRRSRPKPGTFLCPAFPVTRFCAEELTMRGLLCL